MQKRSVELFTASGVYGQLRYHGVDTSNWGKVATKGIEDLVAELNAGESILGENSEGLLRKVAVLGLDVFVRHENKVYILAEDHQVFNDGSTRSRNLSTSLGEKIKAGETAENTVLRALSEELGIGDGAVKVLRMGAVEETLRSSSSYPSLPTSIVMHYAAAMIDPSEYNVAGYVERQDTKSIYFSWREFSS